MLLLALATALSAASADLIFSMNSLPDWQKTSEMELQLTAVDGAAVPLTYSVVPLTMGVGLNQTERARDVSDGRARRKPSFPVLLGCATCVTLTLFYLTGGICERNIGLGDNDKFHWNYEPRCYRVPMLRRYEFVLHLSQRYV
jgi:hypothetical protein